ncbi:hypothetical protein BsWGS_00913 [Bradybaena similaris]
MALLVRCFAQTRFSLTGSCYRQCTQSGCLKKLKIPAVRSLHAFQHLKNGTRSKTRSMLSFGLFTSLRNTTTAAVLPQISPKAQKIVGTWMIGCAGMCFGAVILGGVTRLTESGLSMVDWKLLKDMTLPSSEAAWQEEFEKYKQFPEYKYMESKKEMTLSDFKFIFYMEWAHRMWGRATGLVFLLPAIYFLRKGWISRSMKPRLALFAGLIGLQGFLGWYMVKSGLEDKPDPSDVPRVSQYRLATHLGAAIVLYTLFLWQGFNHLLPPIKMADASALKKLRGMAHGVKAFVFLTAVSGAFVAGLDAGLTYNSYPTMAGKWIPDDMWTISPKWKNIFENPTFVQFNHRHLAEATVVLIAGFWWMARKAPLHPRARLAVNLLLGMAFGQAALGITTLLTYVPTSIAATHQSGSLVLLSLAVWMTHELRRLPK